MRTVARLAIAFLLLAGCGGGSDEPRVDAAAADGGVDAVPPDAAPLSDMCVALGLPVRAWADGPYGVHRGELADDFTVALVGGAMWTLRDAWTGCDSYVFVPDSVPTSALDATSIWEHDLDALVAMSPRNVHYFFVSRAGADDVAGTATAAMQQRIDGVLAQLPAADAALWRSRLHVVAGRAATLGGWLQTTLASGPGRAGLAIDRQQRVRGIGMLADVTRYDTALDMAGQWPWKSNLAYVVHEVAYMNAQGDVQARLDAETTTTVVPLWSGEVLAEFAETDVALPSAAAMAAFDTLEIEVTQRCPNAEVPELGNCGAWDYLASLAVTTPTGNVELARAITSYHRETHWVIDASPLLPLLAAGGMQHFRWDFAPSWNTQPTSTWLSLRLSSRGKPAAPAEATFLWGGGPFNAMYNDTRTPIDVAIPADAARVELVAIVTGHGAGTNTCAEFCNHQHEFTVNGAVHLDSFPLAATEQGCIAQVANGMTPNQGGTWWFGRGGWCPGQQVDPWVVDVTADVTPGATATVSYRGLLGGVTPPDGAGDIVLGSWLVVYR